MRPTRVTTAAATRLADEAESKMLDVRAAEFVSDVVEAQCRETPLFTPAELQSPPCRDRKTTLIWVLPACIAIQDHGGNGVHNCPICKGQMNSRAKRRGYCDIHFCVEITAAKEAKEAKEKKARREKQVTDAIEKKKAEGAKKAGGGGK
nr:hypothetical protein B0A51_11670 [Rachicladosporium sp. CCFEE 5018]